MPTSKYKLERKYEMCGNTFLTKTVYSKYYSRHCSEAAYRAKKREEKKEQHRHELADKVPQERPYISIAEAVITQRKVLSSNSKCRNEKS